MVKPTDDERAYMALETAMRAGDLERVRALFAGDAAFPNVRDPLTWTPLLSLAISWAPLAFVRQLLDLGAEPNFEADDGFPAVYGALDTNRPDRLELVELLIAHGADVNAQGFNDYTALHVAVNRCDAEAIALLLARGANPEIRTRIDDCATPLEEAERSGNTQGAALLRRLLRR